MNIMVEHIKALKPYVSNIEELVSADDVVVLLDTIDDLIVNDILANGDEPSEEGINLQKVYDQIFVLN